ncbi:hypothetical protein I317_02501 [Kwoniella heveanensis CBS 569]|nr:hypothetical protein I317_02501 [Kwoniella heveanensis CBS 569]
MSTSVPNSSTRALSQLQPTVEDAPASPLPYDHAFLSPTRPAASPLSSPIDGPASPLTPSDDPKDRSIDDVESDLSSSAEHLRENDGSKEFSNIINGAHDVTRALLQEMRLAQSRCASSGAVPHSVDGGQSTSEFGLERQRSTSTRNFTRRIPVDGPVSSLSDKSRLDKLQQTTDLLAAMYRDVTGQDAPEMEPESVIQLIQVKRSRTSAFPHAMSIDGHSLPGSWKNPNLSTNLGSSPSAPIDFTSDTTSPRPEALPRGPLAAYEYSPTPDVGGHSEYTVAASRSSRRPSFPARASSDSANTSFRSARGTKRSITDCVYDGENDESSSTSISPPEYLSQTKRNNTFPPSFDFSQHSPSNGLPYRRGSYPTSRAPHPRNSSSWSNERSVQETSAQTINDFEALLDLQTTADRRFSSLNSGNRHLSRMSKETDRLAQQLREITNAHSYDG